MARRRKKSSLPLLIFGLISVVTGYFIMQEIEKAPRYQTDYSRQQPVVFPVKESSKAQVSKLSEGEPRRVIKAPRLKKPTKLKQPKRFRTQVKEVNKALFKEDKVDFVSKRKNLKLLASDKPKAVKPKPRNKKEYKKWIKSDGVIVGKDNVKEKHPCEIDIQYCPELTAPRTVPVVGVVVKTGGKGKKFEGDVAIGDAYDYTPAVHLQ